VRAGEVVALVGPSGPGNRRSSISWRRFYDPTEGGIRLDGVT
jgi:ABC-type multidrug transport system fused ATPase/permease subunit